MQILGPPRIRISGVKPKYLGFDKFPKCFYAQQRELVLSLSSLHSVGLALVVDARTCKKSHSPQMDFIGP